jgi:hypothetical protein
VNDDLEPLSADELAAQAGTPLPDKEVVSILDLNADLDLGLDVAAPIDLAVAANANVAAPIDAAVGANILSDGSTAQAMAAQGVQIDQGLTGEAVATAPQESTIDQSEPPATEPGTDTGSGSDTGTTPDADDDGTGVGALPTDPASILSGDLLNVDVDLAADLDMAAPIAGAVAANANVAAPIDAAVAANIASSGSEAVAVAQQDAVVSQHIDATAEATADQKSEITQ